MSVEHDRRSCTWTALAQLLIVIFSLAFALPAQAQISTVVKNGPKVAEDLSNVLRARKSGDEAGDALRSMRRAGQSADEANAVRVHPPEPPPVRIPSATTSAAADDMLNAGKGRFFKKIEPSAEPKSNLPVPYDPNLAASQRLGRSNVTPDGRTITDHAADRMVNGGPGRRPMSMQEVDQVLNQGNKIKKFNMDHPDGPTVTIQNERMPGKPRVTVDMKTGKRVVTVIQPNSQR